MRTERALGGEPQHLRPKGREHPGHVDLRSDVRSGIHSVEVLAHVLERTRVALPARPHDRGMAHAEPEQKAAGVSVDQRSEEHTSELQSPCNLVCRLLLEK